MSGCLGHCGKGPNCNVVGGSQGRSIVVKGLKKMSKIEALIMDHIEGFEQNAVQKKVAKLKYTARREEKPADRLAKIAEALALLGPEAKASASEPTLFAQLLVMRARETVKSNAAAALKDAQTAIELVPDWAMGQIVLSQALEASTKIHEATEAMAAALKIGYGVDKQVMKRQLQRLERRAAEVPPLAIAPEEAPTASAAPTEDQREANPKSKAKARRSSSEDRAESSSKPEASDKKARRSSSSTPTAEKKAEEVIEEIVEELPEFQEWKIGAVKKVNHDCLRIEMSCSEKTVQNYAEDIWHIDLLAEMDEFGDEQVRRSYTPVSSATQLSQGFLDLMVKVVPGGRMSQHVASLQQGATMLVSQPHITLSPSEYRGGVVMIAGGSAVTVALQVCESILRLVERRNEDDALTMPVGMPGKEVHLFMCNKTAEDVLFADRFEELLQANPSFHVTHCLSQGQPPAPATGGRATWRTGRIDAEVLGAVPRSLK
ncbi:unnamed protein product, partial [Polarella glacialis]